MTDQLKLASKFINNTSSHIFLTGKAGTGKTTFLRNLVKTTHKQLAVVAPTGIAALNAKGVTIHSQFLLPMGTFIPVNEPVGNYTENTQAFSQYSLSRHHPLNNIRKQVLRNIDLLIIDEVSMLRADIMDAIDYRMKSAKGNFAQSFGGVQLLMIGDLFQLSPIIRNNEWPLLRPYYQDGYFYESLALKKDGFVYVELEKVFRQADETFIGILNNLRNNTVTQADIDTLNQHVYAAKDIPKNTITLTTHNRIADTLNSNALSELKGKTYTFQADVQRDFPASMFPVSETIELKEGTRVMFIKNDTQEGLYFNGKLATVSSIDDKSITVKMDGDDAPYTLKRETWENKRYTIHPETKEQEEEVIGAFSQYPIKLAWAITVHKSQGLTFEKAAIDVGEAFATGQVYVALSRLKSLDGLYLTSPISKNVIQTDQAVASFSATHKNNGNLTEALQKGQQNYIHRLLEQSFSFAHIIKQISYTQNKHNDKLDFEDESLQSDLDKIKTLLFAENTNTQNFRKQLLHYLYHKTNDELIERVKKGSDYYIKLFVSLMEQLLVHIGKVRQFSKTKTYVNQCLELDQLIYQQLCEIGNCSYYILQILADKEIVKSSEKILVFKEERDRMLKATGALKNLDTAGKSSGRKKKNTGEPKKKRVKGETYLITHELLSSGKSIEEVAKERDLTTNTIEGHVAKLIGLKKLAIGQFLPKDAIAKITLAIGETKDEGSSACFDKLGGNYSYNQIKMVQMHLEAAEMGEL